MDSAPPAWHREARLHRANGHTLTEIAEAVGRSPSSVHRALHPERTKAQNAARKDYKRDWQRRNPPPRKTTVEPDPGIPGLLPIRQRVGQRVAIVDFARVDLEDWHRFRHLRFARASQLGYPATKINGKRVYLHGLVLPIDKASGLECDHINRDPLDNRRSNLRAVTHLENCGNRGGIFDAA